MGGYPEGIEARRVGFEIRDTLLVLTQEGPVLAFLFRKPCSEPTVAGNVLRHGTGALNIDWTRVGNSGGTPSIGTAHLGDHVEGFSQVKTDASSAGSAELAPTGDRVGDGPLATKGTRS